MEKTRSIDFATISLKDALDLAELVEDEANERYSEFVDQMVLHHNAEAARFFRFMSENEAKHAERLKTRRKALFGDAPRTVRREMIFDVEALDYDAVRAGMTIGQALDAALHAEEKAWTFFDHALEKVKDESVRKLFEELRTEELEHQELVKKEIKKLLPADQVLISLEDVEDDPVAL